MGISSKSGPLDEAVHHHLVPGLVESDGELVVLDALDRAVTEFLMEDAVAGFETADAPDLVAAHRHGAALDERRPRARRPAWLAQNLGLPPAREVARLGHARH